ncbi:MAG: chemotaxis protein CheB [Nitrospinae bacterium]|nr:chemotaxis protein CheB [Nitrospinota bacterium]
MRKSTRESNDVRGFVAIGASLGGSDALRVLLSGLPENFPAPVGVVLHRDREGGALLTEYLRKDCPLEVREAEDKTPIAPGIIYIAPANYHLLVEKNHFALSTEAPVNHARPAIDVFFESVAEAFGKYAAGALLTGNSDDGARGLTAIKRYGGMTVVQSPETALASRMPSAALADAEIDRVLPLDEIAPFLAETFTSRK